MSNYNFERDQLIKRRNAAETALKTGNNLTADQREQLIRFIQAADRKLGNGSERSNSNDIPSTGLNILSFLIPLVGLILYLVLNDSKPNQARSAGKWALIAVCISVGLTFLSYLLIFLF